MTKIYEFVRIQCPSILARTYIYESLGAFSGWPLPLLAELTVPIPGTSRELTKAVNVEYEAPENLDDPWRVSWRPEPGGIYPSFEGVLTIVDADNARATILELEGQYEPPLGMAGAAFDAAIGHRIATATANRLLAGIAAEIHDRYAREETRVSETTLE